MADDEPIEFRPARRSSALADWIGERARRDGLIYAGAAVVLVPLALTALLGTWAVLFGILYFLNLSFCGVGTWLVHLADLAVIGVLFWTNATVNREEFEKYEVDLGVRGKVGLAVSRLTGHSWMMFLASPSDMHAFVRIISNGLLFAPRLFEMAWAMWKVGKRLRAIDPQPVAKAVALLIEAGGRVSLESVLEEFPDRDPQRFIDELTAVDGVIFLSSDPPGLTVTPPFVEEFETWRKERRKKRDRAEPLE